MLTTSELARKAGTNRHVIRRLQLRYGDLLRHEGKVGTAHVWRPETVGIVVSLLASFSGDRRRRRRA